MSKRGIIALSAVGLLSLGAGAAGYLLGWVRPIGETAPVAESPRGDRTVKDALAAASETAAALLGDEGKAVRSGPGHAAQRPPIDVSRINPSGTSVIAGRAAPDAKLTIIADGVPIATAVADNTGAWVVVTDHPFKTRDPEIKVALADSVPPPKPFASKSLPPAASAPGQSAVREAAPGATADAAARAPAASDGGLAPSVKAVTSRMMGDLEQLVESAKKDRELSSRQSAGTAPETGPTAPSTSEGAAASRPPQPATGTASGAVSRSESADDLARGTSATKSANEVKIATAAQGLAAATSANASSSPSAQLGRTAVSPGAPAAIPIPVLFVYNQAEFTPEGRRAAELLLEYLKVKAPDAVTLTGHADERGTEAFNMDLSHHRLLAVRRFLTDGGFTGSLLLVPKGESEPFTGVDRSTFSREELFQLDRRVELRLDR